ncbi:MAG: S9 family peptidase, partial [Acidobacteriota bacterium]|nr:S9 family peptidase [Acidobacteriota bacterium]
MKKIFFLFVLFTFCGSALAQNYSIERYLNIRSAGSPTFSADSGRIAFLTNITGTSQIWMMPAGGGYPEQITAYQDNVGFVEWSPNGSGLIFGKAIGGNENTQFFWLSNDGSEIKELTNNPTVRYNFADYSHDGAKIYYSSNKRDRNFFDIYSMTLADGKEELLYQQDGNNDFAAASKDGSKIIISRDGIELSLDNNLYLVDLKSKQETLLTQHEGASQIGVVDFLDDNTVLLASNDGREFANFARMDLRTKKVEFLDDTNWDLGGGEISDDGRLFAYTINREGFSELYIIETRDVGKKSPAVKLPAQGIVGGLEFSKDGKKLAFTFNSAKNNNDIWIYDVQSKSLTQLTKSSRSGIPNSSFVEPELIKYKSFDGKEITAWYYKPQNKMPNDKLPKGTTFSKISTKHSNSELKSLPVIVSVHGGPEGQERPGFSPLYQYYLLRGYAVLATNVRGSTGYGKTFTHLDDVQKREDSVKDLAFAVEWLKANGADAKRIAVMGGSYGGYMTMAAITLYPDLFAAAVNTVGIVNWETFLKNTSGYRRRQREVEYGRLDRDLDFLRNISPLAKVDKIKTPLFVIHGRNDPRVPYTEAEQVVKALKDRGAIVEYKLYDDEGHGISKLKNRLELYPLVADFLDKYMK